MSSRSSGADLLHVFAEQLRGEVALAGAHPVAVPAQRVDLPVVGEHPVRVRQLPARERVRGEARVHQREAAREARVPEVGEVARQLGRREHPLVDDRARGEARDREVVGVLALHDPPDHIELPLERVAVGHAVAGRAHEELGDVRGACPRSHAGGALVDRHLAPADHALALGLHAALDQVHRATAQLLVLGQEAHRHAVAAGIGKLEPGVLAQERVGNLDEDARAVTRVRVGALTAAMLELLQRVQRAGDHLVRTRRAHACDERDAAGVVLVGRVVQAGHCLQGSSPPRNPRLLRAGARRAGSAKL